MGPENLISLAASQWKNTRSSAWCCSMQSCAGPFTNALCSFLSCRAEKTEVLSEDLLQVRPSAAGLTCACGAGCSSISVLVDATVSCSDEMGWEEEEGIGSVRSSIASLPHAFPSLSQPASQVSCNRIRSCLCQDGNLIQLDRLQTGA